MGGLVCLRLLCVDVYLLSVRVSTLRVCVSTLKLARLLLHYLFTNGEARDRFF